VTPQVTAHAAGRHLRELASALRPHGVGHLVASAAVAGLGGIIVARALGPKMRGEYAVSASFGVALMIGGIGQPAHASGPGRA
jgi:hypothetical protein